MGEFASKGVAGSALGLGIAGLSVALLNGNQNGGGILGNLFGNNCGCSQTQSLMAENAMLKAEKYTDQTVAAVYKANRDEKDALADRLLDKYISPMAQEIASMRVREAETAGAIDCLSKSTTMRFENVYRELECTKKECGAAIALEGERRINGDNSIMCFVQGNYVQGRLVMPKSAICPEVMPRWNSYTTPTNTAPDVQSNVVSVTNPE
jgi:hypothetical protein